MPDGQRKISYSHVDNSGFDTPILRRNLVAKLLGCMTHVHDEYGYKNSEPLEPSVIMRSPKPCYSQLKECVQYSKVVDRC